MPQPNAVVFKNLASQPRVQNFLTRALAEKRISHAYLFLGAPGSGMVDAAFSLAQALMCPNGGDGSCDECIRISHRTHPDVTYLTPGSATGYLIAQIRELIDKVSLAPVRATSKVYILDNVDLLRGTAANALLKTIEEPPSGVYFILIARSADIVLPTIVSRCQQVPFTVVSEQAAEKAVELICGIGGADARIALSIATTPERAAEFLLSSERRHVREVVVHALAGLSAADSWDVLQFAKHIVDSVRAPLADFKKQQEDARAQTADYLSAAALKQITETHKRELTARERSGMIEALCVVQSLLRDVLMRCEGVANKPINEDYEDVVVRIAQATSIEGVVLALEATEDAHQSLNHNVVPQLVFETMLLTIKEALACPPSFR